jgi:hypothetical protein
LLEVSNRFSSSYLTNIFFPPAYIISHDTSLHHFP